MISGKGAADCAGFSIDFEVTSALRLDVRRAPVNAAPEDQARYQ
jgi:hypothetical protein